MSVIRNGTNGFTIRSDIDEDGGPLGARLGQGVGGPVDFNHDGVSDIVFGMYHRSRLYVIYGKSASSFEDLRLLDPEGEEFEPSGQTISTLVGSKLYSRAGDRDSSLDDNGGVTVSISYPHVGVGDINGDGVNDLIAPNLDRDSSGLTDNGLVYVVFGGDCLWQGCATNADCTEPRASVSSVPFTCTCHEEYQQEGDGTDGDCSNRIPTIVCPAGHDEMADLVSNGRRENWTFVPADPEFISDDRSIEELNVIHTPTSSVLGFGQHAVMMTVVDGGGANASCTYNVTVVDFDECVEEEHDCNEFALCTNAEGSFSCQCNAGFGGDGVTCVECPDCTDSQTCVTTGDSYLCDEKPTITCPPAQNVYTDTGSATWAFALDQFQATATVTDVEEQNLTPTFAPQGSFQIGSKNVTASVTDSNGGEAFCTFTVNVIDQEPPTIDQSCQSALTLRPKGASTSVADSEHAGFAVVTVTDNDGEQPTLTYSPDKSQSLDAGSHVVTLTAMDKSGNNATCTFTVFVEACPANSEREMAGGSCACEKGFYFIPKVSLGLSSGQEEKEVQSLLEVTEWTLTQSRSMFYSGSCVKCPEHAACYGGHVSLQASRLLQSVEEHQTESALQTSNQTRRLQASSSSPQPFTLKEHARPIPNPGYSLTKRYFEAQVTGCPVVDSCSPAEQAAYQTVEPGTGCREGMEGPLCSECSHGWRSFGYSDLPCQRCFSDIVNVLLLFTAFFLTGLVVAFYTRGHYSALTDEAMPTFKVLVKIFVLLVTSAPFAFYPVEQIINRYGSDQLHIAIEEGREISLELLANVLPDATKFLRLPSVGDFFSISCLVDDVYKKDCNRTCQEQAYFAGLVFRALTPLLLWVLMFLFLLAVAVVLVALRPHDREAGRELKRHLTRLKTGWESLSDLQKAKEITGLRDRAFEADWGLLYLGVVRERMAELRDETETAKREEEENQQKGAKAKKRRHLWRRKLLVWLSLVPLVTRASATVFVVLYLLSYELVLETLYNGLACDSVGGMGRRLVNKPSIACDSVEFKYWENALLIIVLVYCVAIPLTLLTIALIYTACRKRALRRKKISPTGLTGALGRPLTGDSEDDDWPTVSEVVQTVTMKRERILQVFSFALGGYKSQFFYWEILVIFQRLLSTFVGSYRIAEEPKTAISFQIIVGIVFLTLQSTFNPFQVPVIFEVRAGVALLCILLAVIALAYAVFWIVAQIVREALLYYAFALHQEEEEVTRGERFWRLRLTLQAVQRSCRLALLSMEKWAQSRRKQITVVINSFSQLSTDKTSSPLKMRLRMRGDAEPLDETLEKTTKSQELAHIAKGKQWRGRLSRKLDRIKRKIEDWISEQAAADVKGPAGPLASKNIAVLLSLGQFDSFAIRLATLLSHRLESHEWLQRWVRQIEFDYEWLPLAMAILQPELMPSSGSERRKSVGHSMRRIDPRRRGSDVSNVVSNLERGGESVGGSPVGLGEVEHRGWSYHTSSGRAGETVGESGGGGVEKEEESGSESPILIRSHRQERHMQRENSMNKSREDVPSPSSSCPDEVSLSIDTEGETLPSNGPPFMPTGRHSTVPQEEEEDESGEGGETGNRPSIEVESLSSFRRGDQNVEAEGEGGQEEAGDVSSQRQRRQIPRKFLEKAMATPHPQPAQRGDGQSNVPEESVKSHLTSVAVSLSPRVEEMRSQRQGGDSRPTRPGPLEMHKEEEREEEDEDEEEEGDEMDERASELQQLTRAERHPNTRSDPPVFFHPSTVMNRQTTFSLTEVDSLSLPSFDCVWGLLASLESPAEIHKDNVTITPPVSASSSHQPASKMPRRCFAYFGNHLDSPALRDLPGYARGGGGVEGQGETGDSTDAECEISVERLLENLSLAEGLPFNTLLWVCLPSA
uniref:HYR domain-containing protein n=1 Tax=Chromera velia CCMP2878 TaxID=1169474 RepID=A0A0G4G6D2_9ALVE|eukprot:Cvel_20484.t1-p1 / transcript=Cvel_20484.t1 / gene=Cvel_20484 / organism=Chromera_velia_CCMP2878 / gene_product=Sushi, von Willebrand factor type A, EGF and, putative / transcript_product=Sushi, von Willebrand factor type A, EGF and, putative / location=Cvel_scaffold1841:22414-33170(+) / protein_length=1882 / sequence_SO=supercontig / SO=protein_coding / is_pseudo=false